MLHHVRAAVARVRELFRARPQSGIEQDEEFSFHLEMETAENVRRGMNEADARRAALIRFGGRQRFREETQDARGVVAIDNLARDARFAIRRLERAPGFAAGVIATLGVGIGVACGIGTIVYGVLLRDLPYPDSDRIVRVGFHTPGFAAPGDLHSEATFVHLAQGTRSFTEMGAYWMNDAVNLTDGETPERVTAAFMTPTAFSLLGARPLLGQLFEPGDTSWSKGTPILISENLWRQRYGADPAIIGRSIGINLGARTVIGVLPRSFDFPSPAVSLWYPPNLSVARPQISSRGYDAIGRLRDGAEPATAEAELNALVATMSERFPAVTPDILTRSQARVTVTPLKAATVAPVRAQLIVLGLLVAAVLLIATTNVVNLFLLRTERASQEIAIALAMGASRLALAQRFVMEGLALGLVSSVVALPVTVLALSTKFGFTEREIPRLHEVGFTFGTFVLVVGATAVLGAGVGLVALTRTGIAGLFDRLRSSRSTATRAWRRAQDGLVAFQVAIALVLLVAAGLLGRSFWNLRNADIGFQPDNAMTVRLSLPFRDYPTYAKNAEFHAQIMDRLAALPGVTAVAGALHLPLASRGAPSLELQLHAEPESEAVAADGNMASADYFRVMGIPLRSGRSFQPGDVRAPAVVLSERLATRLYGTTDVVGRTLTQTRAGAPTRGFTIVGVVGDVHWERIEADYVPTAYFPLLRDGDGLPPDSAPVPYRPRSVQYVIRGTQLPALPAIQRIVRDVERRVPPTDVRALGSLVDDATARVRLTMLLIAIAGVAALILGVIGVYSVVSYAANGRVREFGVRIALGAAPGRVARLVLGDGLRLVLVGAITGLAAALAATRFLRALLYEVNPTSVAEFVVATALLVLVTLLAILLPARRAARTDPALVLRGE